jgi:hypothetical protein
MNEGQATYLLEHINEYFQKIVDFVISVVQLKTSPDNPNPNPNFFMDISIGGLFSGFKAYFMGDENTSSTVIFQFIEDAMCDFIDHAYSATVGLGGKRMRKSRKNKKRKIKKVKTRRLKRKNSKKRKI